MKRIYLAIFIVFTSTPCFGEKKLDLEDLQIKGELHGDNRLRIISRDKNKIKNYVKFRTHFRKEIVEGLPKPLPQQVY